MLLDTGRRTLRTLLASGKVECDYTPGAGDARAALLRRPCGRTAEALVDDQTVAAVEVSEGALSALSDLAAERREWADAERQLSELLALQLANGAPPASRIFTLSKLVALTRGRARTGRARCRRGVVSRRSRRSAGRWTGSACRRHSRCGAFTAPESRARARGPSCADLRP